MSVIRQIRWVSLLTLCGVAVMAAGIFTHDDDSARRV